MWLLFLISCIALWGFTSILYKKGADKDDKYIHYNGGVFHSDMVQIFPETCSQYSETSSQLDADMISVSGHKFGCPKGIGFLYIRDGLDIKPLIYGAGQENGFRVGTENLPYIVGLSAALSSLNFNNRYTDNKGLISDTRIALTYELLKIPKCHLNGHEICRLTNNINISFKGIKGTDLATLLNDKGIYVSTGSACNSGTNEPSYVLEAIGVSDDYIDGTILLTVNNLTNDDIEYVVQSVRECVDILRSL